MARIVLKSNGKDVLESVKWKEYLVIYVQSVVLNFFIVCKNILWTLKGYFDYWFDPTRQHIANKFPALSLIRSSRVKDDKQKHQQSIACPHQLMDAQLGTHKSIKLKVRNRSTVEVNDSGHLHFDT